jgi:transposase-like protein
MMTKISYSGYRFPPEIIQKAIWLYIRFSLSFRDVENLLAERGIMVSYETVRRWVNHFGPTIAAKLRTRRPKPHTIWHLDEVSKSMAAWSICGEPSTPRAKCSTFWSKPDATSGRRSN